MVWYLMCLGILGVALLVALIVGAIFAFLGMCIEGGIDGTILGYIVGTISFFIVIAIGVIGMAFFGWGS